MEFTIRRLEPGDEATLAQLALEDGDFDVDGRGEALEPLRPEAARRFLANPAVLFWVAEAEGRVQGFLYCLQVPMRTGPGDELLLYEIATRSSCRRMGVGRRMLAEMDVWMKRAGMDVAWLGADNDIAEAFYTASGFEPDDPNPVFMARSFAHSQSMQGQA